MLPRDGAFALCGKVDDDFRLLLIEQLKQKIELMGHVPSVIFIPFTALDPQRERLRSQRIAADSDHLLGVSMIQQVECGMNAETSPTSENCIRLTGHPARSLLPCAVTL